MLIKSEITLQFFISENKQTEILQHTSSRQIKIPDPTLQENSCVEVSLNDELYYGLIRWIGKIEEIFGNILIAGLELVSNVFAKELLIKNLKIVVRYGCTLGQRHWNNFVSGLAIQIIQLV